MKDILIEHPAPMRLIWRRAAVVQRLGRTVFRDCIKHGWLKRCTYKPPKGKRFSNASVFFSVSDIDEVERRLLSGEYPGATKLRIKNK